MSTNLKQFVTDVADAIREKARTTDLINPQDFPDKIKNIPDIPREIKDGVFQAPSINFEFKMPSTALRIGEYALYDAFRSSTGLTNVDLSSILHIYPNGAQRAFAECPNLISANLSSLYTIESQGAQYIFSNCTKLENIDLSSLYAVISGGLSYAFNSCTSLRNITFNSLESIAASGLLNAFSGCTNLQSISFPAASGDQIASSAFNNMLKNVTGCTVHFPASAESVIGSWSSVTSGFGGTNTVVLFDL